MAENSPFPAGAKVLIAGCLVSLLLGVGFVSTVVYLVVQQHEQGDNIDAVLRLDDGTLDGSGGLREVVAAMEAIDLSACPEDFQVAYRDHIAAWQKLADIEAQYPTYDALYEQEYALKEAATYGATPDFAKLDLSPAETAKLIETWDAANTEKDTTYFIALDIAHSYNATYGDDYYDYE